MVTVWCVLTDVEGSARVPTGPRSKRFWFLEGGENGELGRGQRTRRRREESSHGGNLRAHALVLCLRGQTKATIGVVGAYHDVTEHGRVGDALGDEKRWVAQSHSRAGDGASAGVGKRRRDAVPTRIGISDGGWGWLRW